MEGPHELQVALGGGVEDEDVRRMAEADLPDVPCEIEAAVKAEASQ